MQVNSPMTTWSVNVITLMPGMYPGPLAHALIGDALQRGLWSLATTDLREFGLGVHRKVDDSPYGGGAGMVLKPDVVDAAIHAARSQMPDAALVHLTPRGERLSQPIVRELAAQPLILLSGRYEGVDERVIEKHRPRELSLGDFILTGGDLAAMAVIEACARLLPGVVGKGESLDEESFGVGEYARLLEYPHYTKPAEWEGREVPPVLTGGNHAEIARFRRAQAQAITRARRPDLLKDA